MTKEPGIFHGIEENFLSFVKWMFIAILVGLVVGTITTGFHHIIDIATETRMHYKNLIFLLPFGGAVIAFLYKKAGLDKEKGTNAVLSAVRSSEVISGRTAPLIFIGTVITHLCGGSSGREGAALQLGGSLSSIIGRKLNLSSDDMKTMTICGMAAGFSAMFGTPVTSVVFAMEVAHVGNMNYYALVPALFSSIAAFLVSQAFGVPATKLSMLAIPELHYITLFQVIALALLCALVCILFCLALGKISRLYKLHITNKMIRGFVGGLIVLILTLIVGNFDYNGGGMEMIKAALTQSVPPQAFLIKILFTAITLGAGFKGGEIIPSFFIGATFGNVIGGLLGLDPSFAAGIGLISVFCGVTNCPLASLILSIEIFGVEGIIYFALACGVSYMLSGYSGLYGSQKIVYSKAKYLRIDSHTIH